MSTRKDLLVILVALISCLVRHILCAGIVYNENDVDSDRYYFGFRTDNGIERKEEGKLKDTPTGNVLSIAGSYEYESDGVITIVTYIADEHGFKPISQLRKRINNELPSDFTLDNRIDPKLLGSLAGGGLG